MNTFYKIIIASLILTVVFIFACFKSASWADKKLEKLDREKKHNNMTDS